VGAGRRRVVRRHERQQQDVGDDAGAAEQARDGEAEADGEGVDAEEGARPPATPPIFLSVVERVSREMGAGVGFMGT